MSHGVPKGVTATSFRSLKSWRKRAIQGHAPELHCGKPREISLMQNTIKS